MISVEPNYSTLRACYSCAARPPRVKAYRVIVRDHTRAARRHPQHEGGAALAAYTPAVMVLCEACARALAAELHRELGGNLATV